MISRILYRPLKLSSCTHEFFILGVRTKTKAATAEVLRERQLCRSKGEAGVRTNSGERGKEKQVMSNRRVGEERKRGEAWQRKKNKNIYRPTQCALGWERKNCIHLQR